MAKGTGTAGRVTPIARTATTAGERGNLGALTTSIKNTFDPAYWERRARQSGGPLSEDERQGYVDIVDAVNLFRKTSRQADYLDKEIKRLQAPGGLTAENVARAGNTFTRVVAALKIAAGRPRTEERIARALRITARQLELVLPNFRR